MDEELEYETLDDAVDAFMDGQDADDDDDANAEDDPIEEEEGEDEASDEDNVDDDEDEEGDDEDDPEDDDESDDDDEAEGDEEEEGSDDDDDEPSVADDNSVVTVTVDGEETQVPVSELKRLAGQEKALTQRSQGIADQRRLLENQGLYLSKILQDRYEAAKAEKDKYANVDLWTASRQLDDEDFTALKQAKEAAENNFSSIEQEAQSFVKNAQNTRNEMLRAQAQEARRQLVQDIPEWNDNLYADIRNYAVQNGMRESDVNEIVDPAAIKLIHKAMQADKRSEKANTVKKKVRKTPKKTVRKSASRADNSKSKAKAARRKAAQSGSVDDVTDLVMALADDNE